MPKKISSDKIDPSLLRFICNVIENSYTKKDVIDNKIDKKKVVIDVYIILKPSANNTDDRIMLDKLIEDFHTSGQILKVSRLRYYYKTVKKSIVFKKGIKNIIANQVNGYIYEKILMSLGINFKHMWIILLFL